jgi:hypothetical protein
MTDTFDLSDVKRLAAILDSLDLADQDRAALHAIFAWAGEFVAAESGAEVSGFAAGAGDISSGGDRPQVSGGLLTAFTFGQRPGAEFLNPQPLPP